MLRVLSFFVLATSTAPLSGQVFTYSFSDVTTSSGRSSTGATVGALTFSNFSAAGSLSANSNVADIFAFNGWGTGASNGSDSFSGNVDTTRYFEFTVTPAEGFSYTLTSITFSSGRTATGPRQFAVRSSADGFLDNLTGSANPPVSIVTGDVFQFTDNGSTNLVSGQSLTLGDDAFSDLASPTTFRFYAFNSESTGFFRLDNVSIYATTAAIAIPEPSAWAFICSVAALSAAVVVRQRSKRASRIPL